MGIHAAGNFVVSAYEYLLTQGHLPEGIVFTGDSAGGGLISSRRCWLSVAIDPHPAGAVVICAWIDVVNERHSRMSNRNDPLATPEALAENAALYLGNTDPRSPEANPLYADLSGLPPVRILVGTRESLLDDFITFSDIASNAGVSVKLELWADLNHGWYLFPSSIVETEATYNRMGYLIRELTPLLRACSPRGDIRHSCYKQSPRVQQCCVTFCASRLQLSSSTAPAAGIPARCADARCCNPPPKMWGSAPFLIGDIIKLDNCAVQKLA